MGDFSVDFSDDFDTSGGPVSAPIAPTITVDPSTYLDKVTSEYNQQPNFMAMLAGLFQPLVDLLSLLSSTEFYYDINTAVGAQLDTIGLWIGQSRTLSVALPGVFFSWNTSGLGWDQGNWRDPFGGGASLVVLADDDYRLLLKGTVARNNWDGTTPGAYAAWAVTFAGSDARILIQDFGDMSISYIMSGSTLSAVTIALFQAGFFDLRPAGVRIRSRTLSGAPGAKFFAWNEETTSFGGWTEGSWTL